jgi:hypothetical protein
VTPNRGRDPARGPDPDCGLDRVRGRDLAYGPNDDHARLDRGLRPNIPQRIALVRGVGLPNRLLRMAAESSSRRAICNAVLLDTNTLPPIRTLALAAGAECKPSEAEAVRQSKYQPKPVHALLMHRLNHCRNQCRSQETAHVCAPPIVAIDLNSGYGFPVPLEPRGCLNAYCPIGRGSRRIV